MKHLINTICYNVGFAGLGFILSWKRVISWFSFSYFMNNKFNYLSKSIIFSKILFLKSLSNYFLIKLFSVFSKISFENFLDKFGNLCSYYCEKIKKFLSIELRLWSQTKISITSLKVSFTWKGRHLAQKWMLSMVKGNLIEILLNIWVHLYYYFN